MGENHYLEGYKNTLVSLKPISHTGPFAVIDGRTDTKNIDLAARIVGRYSKGLDAPAVTVEVRLPDRSTYELEVAPLDKDAILQSWYV